MQILYLAHRVPYPPDRGDKIRSFHHLRHLAGSHDVDLLAFAERWGDLQWAEALRTFCRTVRLIPVGGAAAIARGGAKLVLGGSFSEGYFGSGAMWRAVRGAAAARRLDLVWACSAAMAQYAAAIPARRRIVDLVDVDSEKWRDFARHARAPLAWAYAVEATRLADCERRAATAADCVLLVSEVEAACLRRAVPTAPVRVVTLGVDAEVPMAHGPAGAPADLLLLFVGALHYRPNVDAVLFFLRAVLPLVRAQLPGIVFTAVGHRPSARLRRALRRAGPAVRLAASVPDVRPYLRAATVFVAPLRFGRGVRHKVLEAMASGVPVVASGVAVDGLAVRDGVHLLLAEEADAFAAAVVALLQDAQRRRILAANALAYVRESHAWDRVLHELDACLDDASGRLR
jgi:sugar transferase (PEP-CTERM/EpsH1 system associated)